ncbi:MAG TPA: winged helix DNA-binding domain-containing protein, partial [Ardenticatenaceae bacterium]|nr:winged helix DNA-binding domain-containing protein [Ardenticatenaceae bacterium]
MQAQDGIAADLAVRARSSGLTVGDLEAARIEERTVVRTWAMRGTLHLVATEDLDWLLPLLGPRFVAAGRRRRAELGLDEETSVRAVYALRDILANHGPLTRTELAAQLDTRGIHTEGQAAIHLIYRAALEGVVCLGPDRSSKSTYVLLEDWVQRGPGMPPDTAREMMARRYMEAYAPAGPEDLASWCGLAMSEVRTAWQAIAKALVEVEIRTRPAWIIKGRAEWLDGAPAHGPIVRLLPRFDTYLLGYRSRELAVASQY